MSRWADGSADGWVGGWMEAWINMWGVLDVSYDVSLFPLRRE